MDKETGGLAAFPEQVKLLLVCINKTHGSISTYDAARYSWKVNPARAQQAEYVMAVSEGIIVGVFQAKSWLPATKSNFQGISDEHGNWSHQDDRFGFVGRPAPRDVGLLYVGKHVPTGWRFKGNPIRYVNV